MNDVWHAIRTNPVRLFAILSAVVALVAFYVTIPVPLVLGVFAAILGVGEGVRSKVWPEEHVIETMEDVQALSTLDAIAMMEAVSAPDEVEE